MESIIHTPILLIGFNRPDVIKESFEYIRKAKPQKLYVAIDGPRKEKEGESKLVEEVRTIVKQVDWHCQTHYKFHVENLGAELSVSSAITWVLETEETVIVLEDDIIAPMAFLRFAQEMLERYSNNENIYMVSSNQWTPFQIPNDEDYLFGVYGHSWGWATWRRAWSRFDLHIGDFSDILSNHKIHSLVNSKNELWYWKNLIRSMQERGRGNNTWDYCWVYIRFKERGLSIIPKYNLTSNIGAFGLHAKGVTEHHFRPFKEDFVAYRHPEKVVRNIEYDMHHLDTYLMKPYSLMVRIKILVKRCLKVLRLR
ncbi:MAG TPA: hypothetical protein VLH61_07265 [Bacteroidales bacterium]|nr:hypothetical protein [Bacteroidales bacterium]